MEGIINPYKLNPNVDYSIIEDLMICGLDGIWFVEQEYFEFEKKIEKLNSIIIKVLNKLKDINSDNKENIIDAIGVKNILKSIKKKGKICRIWKILSCKII